MRRTRIRHLVGVLVLLGSISAAEADAAFPGPNGAIYFTAFASGASEPDVWAVRSDGSGLTDLTDLAGGPGQGRDPAAAPDGTVAFTVGADAGAEIWRMGADGSNPVRLTSNTVADEMPAFSPDGSRIAFVHDAGGAGGRDVWTMGADGGDPAPLLAAPGNDLDPQYLASGDYLFTASEAGPTGDFDIARVPVAGAPHPAATSITFRSAADETHPALPPDRVRLAYAQEAGGQADIFTAYTTDGTDEFALAVDPAVSETTPAFSPDGTKIVYSTAAGLVTATSGGLNARPLTTPGAVGATDPDWAVGEAADATAPQTTIDRSPPRRTRKRTVRFAFSSSEPGSTFECRLDRAAFAACDPAVKYRRLKRRAHRFAVRAVDQAGNSDPSPARARFRVKRRR